MYKNCAQTLLDKKKKKTGEQLNIVFPLRTQKTWRNIQLKPNRIWKNSDPRNMAEARGWVRARTPSDTEQVYSRINGQRNLMKTTSRIRLHRGLHPCQSHYITLHTDASFIQIMHLIPYQCFSRICQGKLRQIPSKGRRSPLLFLNLLSRVDEYGKVTLLIRTWLRLQETCQVTELCPEKHGLLSANVCAELPQAMSVVYSRKLRH